MLLAIEYEILCFINGADRQKPDNLKKTADMPRLWSDVLNYFPDGMAYHKTDAIISILVSDGLIKSDGPGKTNHLYLMPKGYREIALYEQVEREIALAHKHRRDEADCRAAQERLEKDAEQDFVRNMTHLSGRYGMVGAAIGAAVGGIVGALVSFALQSLA